MSVLAKILSSKARALILRELFGLDQAPKHLSKLARRTGMSTTAIRYELEKLVDLDLIERRQDGNRVYFKAKSIHPLFNELHSLVLKTVGLVEVLRQKLKDADIEIAFVFGSISRDEEHATSDIDIMVIGNARSREIAGLLTDVSNVVYREINAHTMTVAELTERINKKEHFITRVLQTKKLFIIGTEDDLSAMGRGEMGQG